jgi:hypothetical protein
MNTQLSAYYQPARPVSLDGPVGVERPSRWSWAVPRVGSLSGEGSAPPAVQGPGTLTPVGNDTLADVGVITAGRGQAWSPARLPSSRTVIAGGRRSWLLG